MSDLSLGFGEAPALAGQQLPPIPRQDSISDGSTITTNPWETATADTANQNNSLELARGLSAPSLNLAPAGGATPIADRAQSDKDYLASLPMAEKIGLALQSFGAGFHGQPSPIDALLMKRRQDRKDSQAELANTMNMLTKGFEIVRKIPPGVQRDAVVAELSKQIGPTFAPLLAGVGTEHDNALRSFASVVTDPDAQKIIFNMCADDPNQQACWMTSMTKPEVAKQIHTIVDGKRMYQGGLLTKVQAYETALKTQAKIAKADDPNADAPTQFTIADLSQLGIFSQDDLETIGRNEKTFAPFGLKTAAVQQAGEIALAQETAKQSVRQVQPDKSTELARLISERDALPAGDPRRTTYDNAIRKASETARQITPVISMADKTAYTNIQPDGKGGFIGLSRASGKMEQIPQGEGISAGGWETRDPATITDDAWYQILNGKARPGSIPTGRAGQGNVYRKQVADEIHKITQDTGMSEQELATKGIENKSNAVALSSNVKDLAMITPYKEMLDKNGSIAIDLGKKIANDKTNSAFINKPLLWLKNNATNNPDVAEYLAQMHFVEVEAARVLNNPRLVGELTDTAVKDMKSVISGSMTLESSERVLRRMMSDGDNRVNAMRDQRERLIQQLRGIQPRTRATDKPSTGTSTDFSNLWK